MALRSSLFCRYLLFFLTNLLFDELETLEDHGNLAFDLGVSSPVFIRRRLFTQSSWSCCSYIIDSKSSSKNLRSSWKLQQERERFHHLHSHGHQALTLPKSILVTCDDTLKTSISFRLEHVQLPFSSNAKKNRFHQSIMRWSSDSSRWLRGSAQCSS